MNDASSLKAAAVAFLQQVVAGHVAQAYDRYVGDGFRHHNPFFAGDADALRQAMQRNEADQPGKVLEVQRALQDGDCVAVHSRLVRHPGDPGMAVVHLFRFSEGRIVEFWDIAQAVPEDSPNRNGMF